ncbi:MAG: competence/damage-inducible protein cinA [Humibacillus sp.]|nr:competence/damage-inducible protein cinA [Humibacillus sp.]
MDWSDLAAELVGLLTRRGETVACAESLTAGLVSASIADVPGASAVLLGGLVTYAARLKIELLGVPASVIDAVGTVDPAVAVAMAEGVRARLGATWGLATTGVAGPGPAEGKPAGTVHVAVAGPSGTASLACRLTGERAQVRASTVREVLTLALHEVGATQATPAPLTDAGGTVGPGDSAAST